MSFSTINACIAAAKFFLELLFLPEPVVPEEFPHLHTTKTSGLVDTEFVVKRIPIKADCVKSLAFSAESNPLEGD